MARQIIFTPKAANPPVRQGAKLPVRTPGLKVSIAAIAGA